MADEDDRDLVVKAQGGDTAAFGVLYLRHRESVFRRVKRILRNYPAAAEDVVQDAFEKVLTSIKDLEDPSKFPGYLNKTAVNSSLTLLRQMRAHPHAQLDEKDPDHYRSRNENPQAGRTKLGGTTIHLSGWLVDEAQLRHLARRDVLITILYRALEQFDERDRKALTLKHFKEMTAKQVAPVVGFARPGRIYDLYKKYVKLCLQLQNQLLKEEEKEVEPADKSP